MSGPKQFRRTQTSGGAVPKYALTKLSSGKLVVTEAKTDATFGINTENSILATDLPIAVEVSGLVKAIASAAISLGALLMAAADGKVITHDASSGTPIIGKAVEAATAANQEIMVLLYDDHRPYPA